MGTVRDALQLPPVLRWPVYEAGKARARTSAPDHDYYAAVKDRKNSKRACLSKARKILLALRSPTDAGRADICAGAPCR